ncbi:Lin1244/Lin1753 domain-containing protein [Anaerosphaera multitolerans]|uniref:DUF4373 domain-containing protein n=1 Tax=Anaerosphaera multitolerans TaxID=2487351 RepID=A0A437S7N7_9FIRM|nr:Lin1244/Lin1753 domain-containing protein [Anaerosphaera multitolerans]RVU54857.1 DUF4373 domain-containing protein [Anaerosphaera multitolerans]
MANIPNYFSHDSNARNSDKLIPVRMKFGAEGYGVYFMILERLREEPGYMSVKDYNSIAFDLRVDASIVKQVVEDFGLFVFTEDGKYFYSESFLRRMEIKDSKSKKLSEAGKKGAEARWKNKDNSKDITNAKDKNGKAIATPSPNDSKIRKDKIRKDKINNNNSVPRDEKLVEVASIYEKSGFGTINSLIAESLVDISKSYSVQWIEEAFKIAVENNKNNLSYVKGILENWKSKGKTNSKFSEPKNKFNNFKQLSDDYPDGYLEDLAKKKREALFKDLEDEDIDISDFVR